MTPEQLADAKAKYHLLVTGQLPRVVLDGNNGDRVEFSGVKAADLLAYIRITDPTYLIDATPAYTRRPIGFMF